MPLEQPNPTERVMSVLNFGMQSVGLARRQLEEEVETEFQRCTIMSQIRELVCSKQSCMTETNAVTNFIRL